MDVFWMWTSRSWRNLNLSLGIQSIPTPLPWKLFSFNLFAHFTSIDGTSHPCSPFLSSFPNNVYQFLSTSPFTWCRTCSFWRYLASLAYLVARRMPQVTASAHMSLLLAVGKFGEFEAFETFVASDQLNQPWWNILKTKQRDFPAISLILLFEHETWRTIYSKKHSKIANGHHIIFTCKVIWSVWIKAQN